jgi:hypothetical protein
VPSSRHWFEVGFTSYLRALGDLLDRMEATS